MFDMSWGEIMVIGGVALIVIGPKDLPKALRTVGQMTSKVRRMASEFQGQFNEAMREAELDEVKKEVAGLKDSVAAATSTAFNPIQTIRDEIRGAVEAKPTVEPDIWGTNPAPGTPDTTVALPGPYPPPGEDVSTPVEEVGPVPHIAPVSDPHPVDPGLFGEATPLVPLPEPPLAAPPAAFPHAAPAAPPADETAIPKEPTR